MEVEVAQSDEEIQAAFLVMKHLRDLSDSAEFLRRVRPQQEQGHLLAVLREDGSVVAAAGF